MIDSVTNHDAFASSKEISDMKNGSLSARDGHLRESTAPSSAANASASLFIAVTTGIT